MRWPQPLLIAYAILTAPAIRQQPNTFCRSVELPVPSLQRPLRLSPPPHYPSFTPFGLPRFLLLHKTLPQRRAFRPQTAHIFHPNLGMPMRVDVHAKLSPPARDYVALSL